MEGPQTAVSWLTQVRRAQPSTTRRSPSVIEAESAQNLDDPSRSDTSDDPQIDTEPAIQVQSDRDDTEVSRETELL